MSTRRSLLCRLKKGVIAACLDSSGRRARRSYPFPFASSALWVNFLEIQRVNACDPLIIHQIAEEILGGRSSTGAPWRLRARRKEKVGIFDHG
jgi:hypothetical protein